MSYKSPIEVITEETILQMEDDIVKAVQKYGINVNKIELQKALMYDRKQYTQGFEDGRKSIEEDYQSMERTVVTLTEALGSFEPIRHGRWEDKYDDGNWHCSVCGAIVEKDEQARHNWNRCYHCGAKMDEVTE